HFYNKDLSAQELIDALKRVIYNGHLYNASGIQEKYQLSDGEFHGITQNAIHHFTDRVEFKNVDFKTADIYEAYMDLISASLDPPENWVLTLYIPTHEGHQTLISAMFKQANLSVDLEMIDPLDHQEEKPEEPTEEETEEEKEKPQEQQKEELVPAKGVQTGVWISFYPSLWMMGIGLFGMLQSRH
ncbi:MAG: thioester-forming surface-anchored protein, partial [Erysipelotrichaceae bacterium]|nr:thioester-forming surface-anchored protein [Erysipelotrichaceae bacterium]